MGCWFVTCSWMRVVSPKKGDMLESQKGKEEEKEKGEKRRGKRGERGK